LTLYFTRKTRKLRYKDQTLNSKNIAQAVG